MKKIKTFGISLLVAACAVCLSLAFVACKGGDKNANSYGVGEEGFYYYDGADSSRYMLSMNSGTYMLSMGDTAVSSGSYSYDESVGGITFSGSDYDFSANIAENTLSIDFTDSGTTYTFFKYVYFDVTYRDVSGEILETSSVLNGKPAEYIEVGRDGYYFINWYSDVALENVYGFNTSITADTSVYAWFVEKNQIATDFWVTYDYGDRVTEPELTKNGTVYALPDADGLLGWWVSATNDGGELTYKYEPGTVLKEDTTFFAVYDGDAVLGASVTAEGVTWENTPGAQVSIKVSSGGVAVIDTSVSSSSRRYVSDKFTSLGTGVYRVSVSSGNATEELVYVVNGLSRVSGFEIQKGTLISFNPVENAQGYIMEISNGVKSETVNLGNATIYDISGWEMTKDGLTYTVTAYAAGYESSISSEQNYSAVLDTVTISFDGDTAVWSIVECATSYEVILDVNGEESRFTTTGSSVSLKAYEYGDEIVITVRPVASGYYSEATVSRIYTKTTLAAPAIENVVGGVIYWTGVSGATGYIVNINGKEITLDNGNVTSFATSDDNFVDGQGSYTVKIKALGNGTSSEYGDAVVITEKDMGSAIEYGSGVISWQYSFAAESYIVKINNEDDIVVTYGNSIHVTFTKAGDNEITVYFIDEYGNASTAASITIFAYEVILDAGEDGRVDKDTLYVAAGDVLYLPDAVSSDEGLTFDAWYTLPDYNLENLEYSGRGVRMETGDLFTGSSTLILYAYYSPAEFEITILYNVDSIETTEKYTVYYKRPFTLPAVEATGENEGKLFAGWYLDEAMRSRLVDSTGYCKSYTYKEDITLYGGWYTYLTFTYITDSETSQNGYAVAKGPEIAAAGVEEITIPATYKGLPVLELQSNAFRNCSWITTMNIPDTVVYIALTNNGYSDGTGALSGCSSLKNVNIYATDIDAERVYYSSDGVLFRYDNETNETKLVYYPYGRTGSYVIPETVYNGKERTYQGNTLTSVVRRVDAVGVQTFANNTKLTSLTVPATVSVIYSQAFYGCTKLTRVIFKEDDDGVDPSLVLEDGVFQGCSALADVTLPSHLAGFDDSMFTGCSSLVNLKMEKDGQSYSVRDGYLCNATGTEIVYCAPGRSVVEISNVGISSIGEGVFAGRTNITEVIIPSWIVNIGESAFDGCTKITSLTFEGTAVSNALTIGSRAFYGCTSLTSVVLPENLKTLDAYAFGGCTSLTEVTVLSSYYSVGNPNFADYAFGTEAGTSVFYVTTLHIGENTGHMNISVVFGTNLSTIEIGGITGDGKNSFYAVVDSVIYNETETELYYFPSGKTEFVSSDSLLYISNSAFRGRTDLTSVTIGAKIETIADYAFYGCTSLSSVVFKGAEEGAETSQSLVIGAHAFEGCSSLVSGSSDPDNMSLVLPSNTAEIGDYAFNGCSSFVSLTIPKGTSRIGKYSGNALVSIYNVFYGCSSLENIYVEEGNGSFYSYNGVLYSSTKDIIYYTPAAHSGNVALTDDTIGLAIEQIWSYAFNNCTYLTEITISASVTFIGANAFYGCSALKKIMFTAEGESVTLENGTSSSGVFMNLSSLEEVGLADRVTSIPDYAFYGDSSLEELSVPDSVTRIGAYAFYNASLTTLDVGNAVLTEIGDYALYSSGITQMNLNEGLERIGDYAFNKSKITSVTVPSSTYYIGKYAFSASSLATIEYAEYTGSGNPTVTIGDYCFYNCSKLQNVGFPSVSTVLGSHVFDSATISNTYNGEGIIYFPGTIVEIGPDTFYFGTIDKVIFAEDSQIETIPKEFLYMVYATDWMSGPKYVNIPASVKKIETEAYAYSMLTEVVFDEGSQLETIGTGAFRTCWSENLTIPASVVEIDDYAFYNSRILNLEFEEGSKLEYIGEYAFSNGRVGELVLPESSSPLELDTACFGNTTYLKSVYISSAVYSINAAFTGCSALESITVSEDSKYFIMYEGLDIVFKHGVDEDEIAIVFGMSDDGVLDLSSTSLKKITEGVFGGDTSLKSVILPDTLEEICDNAFKGCTKLTSVTIPSVVRIGDYAFYNTSLASVALPANLEYIGAYAFHTGDDWDDDSTLASVTFASGCNLREIDTYAFSASVFESLELPDKLETVSSYAFNACKSLKSVMIPDSVTYIGTNVFYNCTKLASANLPANLTSVPAYMFYGCTALASLEASWENITEVGGYALYNCSALGNLTGEMLVSLEYVGEYAFYSCGITGVVDFENTYSVGTQAFAGSKISKVIISADLYDIGDYAFYSCSNLTEFVVDEGNRSFYAYDGMLFDMTKQLICCPGGMEGEVELTENDITELAERAFYGCAKLTSITLPITITAYPSYAFRNCSGLKEFTIAETVTTIGTYAFYGCSGLAVMTIPSSVTSIGSYAFQSCTRLETVTFAENINLTEISSYTFIYCSGLKSVKLPDSVQKIGNYAFRECTSLSDVELNEGLVSTGTRVFYGCTSLKGIKLPSTVTTVGDGLFYECENLEKVELNEGLTLIEQYMFQNCQKLTDVNIPSTVTTINKYAFRYCYALESITIPESVTYIGTYAFQNCESLINIEIPGSVETVDQYAFRYCYKLEEVVIKDGVKTINYEAFRDDTALKTVTLPVNGQTAITFDRYVFRGCTAVSEIVIPKSTVLGNNNFYGWTAEQTIYFEVSSASSAWGSSWKGSCSAAIYWYSEQEPALSDTAPEYDGNYWYYDENGEIVRWEFDYPTYTADDGSYVVCGKENEDGSTGDILYVCFCKTTTVTETDPDTGETTETTTVAIEYRKVTECVADSADGTYSVTLDDGSIYMITLSTSSEGKNSATITLSPEVQSGEGDEIDNS